MNRERGRFSGMFQDSEEEGYQENYSEETITEDNTNDTEEDVTTSLDDLSEADFWDLVKSPKKGSVISKIKSISKGGGLNRKNFGNIGQKFVEEFLFVFLDSDSALMTYVLYRLFLSHSDAITLSEEIGEIARKMDQSELEILSNLTGVEMKERKDLKKLIQKIAKYHPIVVKLLKGIMPAQNRVITQ